MYWKLGDSVDEFYENNRVAHGWGLPASQNNAADAAASILSHSRCSNMEGKVRLYLGGVRGLWIKR